MQIKNIAGVLALAGALGACKPETPDSENAQLKLIAEEHRERCVSAIESNTIEGLQCAAESYAVRCFLGKNAIDHIAWRDRILTENNLNTDTSVWLCNENTGVSITEGPNTLSIPVEDFVKYNQEYNQIPPYTREESLDAQMEVVRTRFWLACGSPKAIGNDIANQIVAERDKIMRINEDIYDTRKHAKWICTHDGIDKRADFEGPHKLGYVSPETPLALEVFEQARKEYPGKTGDDEFIAQHALEILRWRYLSPICKGESDDSMQPIFDARDHISSKYLGFETRWQC